MSSVHLLETQAVWVLPVRKTDTYALLMSLAVMITDLEYPYRPAFSLLTKILDEHASLAAQLPAPSSLASASANAFGGNPSQAAAGGLPPAQKGKLEGTLASYLTKYQDPKQADTIMKVQKELDETKIVLVCIGITGNLAEF